MKSLRKGTISNGHRDALHHAGRTAAGQRLKVGRMRQGRIHFVAGVRDHRPRQRVRRSALQRRKEPQEVVPHGSRRLGSGIDLRSTDDEFPRFVELEKVGDGRRPLGQGAGLVKDDGGNLGGCFGCLTALDEDSQLGPNTRTNLE